MAPTTFQKNGHALIGAYIELLQVRELHIGRTVEDPKRSNSPVETEEVMKALSERFFTHQETPIGKIRIHDKLDSFFKKRRGNASREAEDELFKDIRKAIRQYSNRTRSTELYGLLTPLAFCSESESDLASVLGGSETNLVFNVTWHVQFQQLSAETTNTGLLEAMFKLSISKNELMQWWLEGDLERSTQESNVWLDLKAFALRLVRLFDKAFLTDNVANSTSVRVVKHDTQKKSEERICTQLKRLAIKLIRLTFLRPEQCDDVLEVFELLVPVTYSFFALLDLKDWETIGPQAIAFVENYLFTLRDMLESLVHRLGAVDEVAKYEDADNKSFSDRIIAHIKNTDSNLRDSVEGLRNETTQELARMGLIKINVDLSKEEDIGSGSFSHVVKLPLEGSQEQVAVKFFKGANQDLKRTQHRLLREAKRWSGLSHDNTNPLRGYCIHPEEDFPGLVSPLCTFTLDRYLARASRNVDIKEKLRYLLEIVKGLEYLHSVKRLAHGDLRPPNILLAPNGFVSGFTARITDFGVSLTDDDSDGYKVTTKQHTNDRYIAPELVVSKDSSDSAGSGKSMPEFRQVSFQGDIYAFGCCFMEVLYDRIPFYYTSIGKIKKVKAKGSLPALEKDILPHHWKFLQEACNLKTDKRLSAQEVIHQILLFMA